MSMCAVLAIKVITATQTPAAAPAATASATSPSSWPRSQARSLATATSARRVGSLIATARVEESATRAWKSDLGATPRGSQGPRTLDERHVVAMNHLGAARRAENLGDIARIASSYRLGVRGVVGDQPPSDLRAPFVANAHAVAPRKSPLDALHACRQQALARRERRRGARVDEYGALELERSADPRLAGRDRIRGGEKPGAASALGDARERMGDASVGDDHMRSRGGRNPRRLDLGAHPPARQFGAGASRHRLDLGRDPLHNRQQPGPGVVGRRRVVESGHVGEKDEQVGARHGGDARREAVVVAVANLARRDRIVLVDDRNGAYGGKTRQSGARVEIAPPLLGVLQG